MPSCLDCGKPLGSPRAKRCHSCDMLKRNAESPPSTLWTSETARKAVAAREAKRAETERLAELAREAGLA